MSTNDSKMVCCLELIEYKVQCTGSPISPIDGTVSSWLLLVALCRRQTIRISVTGVNCALLRLLQFLFFFGTPEPLHPLPLTKSDEDQTPYPVGLAIATHPPTLATALHLSKSHRYFGQFVCGKGVQSTWWFLIQCNAIVYWNQLIISMWSSKGLVCLERRGPRNGMAVHQGGSHFVRYHS